MKKLLIKCSFISALIIIYFIYQHHSFKLVGTRDDFISLQKGNKRLVGPTISDIQEVKNYFIGVRLLSEELNCRDGGYFKISVVNKKQYFILNKNTLEAIIFDSKSDFEFKINALNIKLKQKINYKSADKIWDKFGNYSHDSEHCKVINY